MSPEFKKRITRAKVALLIDHPFFGTLATRLPNRESEQAPTARTDGNYIEWNPSFAASLSDAELMGVLAHEVMHVACGHCWRRGDREHWAWNLACDLAINGILLEAGLKLPAGGLFPTPAQTGKAAEALYSPPNGRKGPGPTRIWGEVCDGLDSDCGQAEGEWKIAVAQAAMAAKTAGKLPAGLKRFVSELVEPKVCWTTVLRDFVERSARNDYCIAPETLVLTHDLRWVEAVTLQTGEKLVGVDEYPETGKNHRRLCETTIEKIGTIQSPRIKISTDNCPPITTTPNHKFLVAGKQHNEWKEARDIRLGDKIKYVVAPWREDKSDSWLAGMFDGEGCLSANTKGKRAAGINLRISQNEGPVLERIKKNLSSFPVCEHKPCPNRFGQSSSWSVGISSIPDVLKAIGTYRPTRILPKMMNFIREKRLTLPRPGKSTVTAVETMDEGPAITMKTSSKTLITNGLISHNCWSRANVRHLGRGIILPSLISEELPAVVIAVDTSGSIGPKELDQFAGEISSVLGAYETTIHLVYADAEVAGYEILTRADLPLALEAKGGGGTDFRPVFAWVAEQGLEPAALIYLTDLCGPGPREEPGYPILWVCTTDETAPIGQTLKMELESA